MMEGCPFITFPWSMLYVYVTAYLAATLVHEHTVCQVLASVSRGDKQLKPLSHLLVKTSDKYSTRTPPHTKHSVLLQHCMSQVHSRMTHGDSETGLWDSTFASKLAVYMHVTVYTIGRMRLREYSCVFHNVMSHYWPMHCSQESF